MSPVSKVRKKKSTAQARDAARAREDVRRRYRRTRVLTRIGQALMIIGVLLALEHVGAHLGAFGQQPPLLIDMVAGWPMAGLLVIAGLVLAGQRQYHSR